MSRMMLLAVVFCSLVALSGCGGPKLVPVEGVVLLDGKPVEGATVTFISEDGKNSFSGSTDATGHFDLQSGEKHGAFPGNYKVTVVKNTNKPGAETLSPEEGAKMMKKESEEAHKADKAASKAAMSGLTDPKAKMAAMSGAKIGTAAPVLKSELPILYANGTKTPLTAKVPPDGPVQFDLKSK
jgi:hypothetical protein